MLLPSLVDIDEKNYIISKAGQSMGCWHWNDKCKQVINKSVERLFNMIILNKLSWLLVINRHFKNLLYT